MITGQIAAEAWEKIRNEISDFVIEVVDENKATAIIKAAIEKARLDAWRSAPDQPDVQEAVIRKLDLVARESRAAWVSEKK